MSSVCEKPVGVNSPSSPYGKRDHGTRTVLVLEENDIQLTNHLVVADALLEVEKTMADCPDEVYLVSTAIKNPWWIFALRIDQQDYCDFSPPTPGRKR